MNTPGITASVGSCPGLVDRVEKRLAESIGLNARVVGRPAVNWAVRRRMRTLGLTSEEQYEHHLRYEAEWLELMEALLVNETWFFRERNAFTTLVGLVLRQWAPANPAGPLRLLSIPCASGEEPFSMVMALLDAGFPPERLKVDALDLSSWALALAERGIYSAYSFRSADLSFRSRYFQPVPGGFLLNKNVRDRVRFARGNLLDPRFAADTGGYDYIFCRNLLIYLHESARRRVLERVRSLLAPGGVLFVGVAEQLLAREYGLNPDVAAARSPLSGSSTKQGADKRPRLPELRPAFQTRSPRPVRVAPLEEARQLADAGKLGEATAICESSLREDSTCAGAYYLLGLLREAGGQPGAAEYYRKALYLEPTHRDALLQMALLADKQGHPGRALLFRSRAIRTQPSAIQL